MLSPRIYLDYAASAPLRPQARAAMLEALGAHGNPSSAHMEGQTARALLDASRRTIADILSLRPERLIFTSGGTEANNLAIRGAPQGTTLISAVEHDCIRHAAATRPHEFIPVNPQGIINLTWLETRLKQGGISLVSVMLANNETGTRQPVKEIAVLAQKYGALSHTDAVQAVGHEPVHPDALGVDMLTFTAHKFGGPRGAGVLVVKPEVKLQAQILGGAQERNRRAGTENVTAIVGMAAALQAATENHHAETQLATHIAEKLEANLPPNFTLAAPNAEKLPHLRTLIHSTLRGEDMVIALDIQGIAASQGSACNSGKTKPSHVLQAMGYDEPAATSGLRLSWGWNSTPQDIDNAIKVLASLPQ